MSNIYSQFNKKVWITDFFVLNRKKQTLESKNTRPITASYKGI